MNDMNATRVSCVDLDALDRDEEGFLLDPGDWHPDLVEALADEAGIALTDEHRAVVTFVREYFEERQVVPEARAVLRYMKSVWGDQRATRRYLYRLFPHGYGQQACKLAGMCKPRKLMLDV